MARAPDRQPRASGLGEGKSIIPAEKNRYPSTGRDVPHSWRGHNSFDRLQEDTMVCFTTISRPNGGPILDHLAGNGQPVCEFARPTRAASNQFRSSVLFRIDGNAIRASEQDGWRVRRGGGSICVRFAPQSAMTPESLDRLRVHKPDVLAVLRCALDFPVWCGKMSSLALIAIAPIMYIYIHGVPSGDALHEREHCQGPEQPG